MLPLNITAAQTIHMKPKVVFPEQCLPSQLPDFPTTVVRFPDVSTNWLWWSKQQSQFLQS